MHLMTICQCRRNNSAELTAVLLPAFGLALERNDGEDGLRHQLVPSAFG
jgi:hypothetical protein